jgi:hypothetical protein
MVKRIQTKKEYKKLQNKKVRELFYVMDLGYNAIRNIFNNKTYFKTKVIEEFKKNDSAFNDFFCNNAIFNKLSLKRIDYFVMIMNETFEDYKKTEDKKFMLKYFTKNLIKEIFLLENDLLVYVDFIHCIIGD